MVETIQLLQSAAVKAGKKSAKAAQCGSFQAALDSAQESSSAAIRDTGEKEIVNRWDRTRQKQGQEESATAETPRQSFVPGPIAFVLEGLNDCSLIHDAAASDMGMAEASASGNTQANLLLSVNAVNGEADKGLTLTEAFALAQKGQAIQNMEEGAAAPPKVAGPVSAERGGNTLQSNGAVMSDFGDKTESSGGITPARAAEEARLSLNSDISRANTSESLTATLDGGKKALFRPEDPAPNAAEMKASSEQLAAENGQPSSTLQSAKQSSPSMSSASQMPPDQQSISGAFTASQQESQPPSKAAGENIRPAENAMAGAAFKEPEAVYLNKFSDAQPKTDDARQPEVLSKAIASDQGPERHLNPGRAQRLADTEKGSGNDIETKAVFGNALQAGDAVQSGKEVGLGKADAKPESRAAETPVWNQVSSQIISRAKEGSSSFQMKLKPDGLGQLTVEMTLENGRVSLQMIADSAAAKDAIVSQLDELKTALRANQVDVSQIQVSVEAGGQQQRGSPLGQFGGNESGHGYREDYTKQSKEDLRHEDSSYSPQTDFSNGIIDYKV